MIMFVSRYYERNHILQAMIYMYIENILSKVYQQLWMVH